MTLFINADEEMTVSELKSAIGNVIKVRQEKFRMHKDDQSVIDWKAKDLKQKLKQIGYTTELTPPHDPATIFLTFVVDHSENGKPVYEPIEVEAYSTQATHSSVASRHPSVGNASTTNSYVSYSRLRKHRQARASFRSTGTGTLKFA